MNSEEYREWQRKAEPKCYAESTKARWRKEARAAIEKVIAQGGDVEAAIDTAYPFKKRDCTHVLIWLQERREALERLGK
jgi:hypothetical protein